uniref:Uncharacterized protein n=1 Tax=Rhizophora mucronata TaxID=61149 RepID=A0A2P2Q6A8_RHIMU
MMTTTMMMMMIMILVVIMIWLNTVIQMLQLRLWHRQRLRRQRVGPAPPCRLRQV